jgi:hypothetical protein
MAKKLPMTARVACSLLPLVLLGGRGARAQAPEVPTTTCRPVTPVALHAAPNTCVSTDFMGQPFRVNRRLSPIEAGTVPCIEVDTMEATRCRFETGARARAVSRLAGPASGPWLQDVEGRDYAVVGQPVTRDGSAASGAFIVATVADAEGTTPCVGASGHDAVSAEGSTDMADWCALETAGSETNVTRDEYGAPQRLLNHADRHVGTTSFPHPDGAELVAFDPDRSIAWYTGYGAALNDTGGTERDQNGQEFPGPGRCHLIEIMGYQVPAAKRPSTRTTPYPGSVNVNSRIRWLPVNPYVTIANDLPFDPRGAAPLWARFTWGLGLHTLWVDASPSEGDIVKYIWDLDWTSVNPDATTTSPTTSFPVASEGPTRPAYGTITLTVVGRGGAGFSTIYDMVSFKARDRRFPPAANAAPPN